MEFSDENAYPEAMPSSSVQTGGSLKMEIAAALMESGAASQLKAHVRSLIARKLLTAAKAQARALTNGGRAALSAGRRRGDGELSSGELGKLVDLLVLEHMVRCQEEAAQGGSEEGDGEDETAVGPFGHTLPVFASERESSLNDYPLPLPSDDIRSLVLGRHKQLSAAINSAAAEEVSPSASLSMLALLLKHATTTNAGSKMQGANAGIGSSSALVPFSDSSNHVAVANGASSSSSSVVLAQRLSRYEEELSRRVDAEVSSRLGTFRGEEIASIREEESKRYEAAMAALKAEVEDEKKRVRREANAQAEAERQATQQLKDSIAASGNELRSRLLAELDNLAAREASANARAASERREWASERRTLEERERMLAVRAEAAEERAADAEARLRSALERVKREMTDSLREREDGVRRLETRLERERLALEASRKEADDALHLYPSTLKALNEVRMALEAKERENAMLRAEMNATTGGLRRGSGAVAGDEGGASTATSGRTKELELSLVKEQERRRVLEEEVRRVKDQASAAEHEWASVVRLLRDRLATAALKLKERDTSSVAAEQGWRASSEVALASEREKWRAAYNEAVSEGERLRRMLGEERNKREEECRRADVASAASAGATARASQLEVLLHGLKSEVTALQLQQRQAVAESRQLKATLMQAQAQAQLFAAQAQQQQQQQQVAGRASLLFGAARPVSAGLASNSSSNVSALSAHNASGISGVASVPSVPQQQQRVVVIGGANGHFSALPAVAATAAAPGVVSAVPPPSVPIPAAPAAPSVPAAISQASLPPLPVPAQLPVKQFLPHHQHVQAPAVVESVAAAEPIAAAPAPPSAAIVEPLAAPEPAVAEPATASFAPAVGPAVDGRHRQEVQSPVKASNEQRREEEEVRPASPVVPVAVVAAAVVVTAPPEHQGQEDEQRYFFDDQYQQSFDKEDDDGADKKKKEENKGQEGRMEEQEEAETAAGSASGSGGAEEVTEESSVGNDDWF